MGPSWKPIRAADPDVVVAHRRRARGQVLVLFAVAFVVLLGLAAVVVDVAWYWSSSLRIQRAADAAALAGVVNLPADTGTAYIDARAEATKNGFTQVAGNGVVVTPLQDGTNPRRLNVRIQAPVGMFFMRVFGIGTLMADRTASAEYILPIPMGSPLNYFGVYQNCAVSGSSIPCTNLPSATGLGTLSSQGFFGAIEGQGSNRSTGDAYATNYNPRTTLNTDYDSHGYEYTIELPQAGGTVYVWDPTFCATTSGPGGGHLGAGDHWINSGSVNSVPVSTYFQLWNKGLSLGSPIDDTRADPLGDDALFTNEFQVDRSPAYSTASPAGGQDNNFADGNEPNLSDPALRDCRTGATSNQSQGRFWHNRWWPIATNLAAGTYRLQVMTTNPSDATANQGQMFENMWSIQASGGGNPKIYGSGRMVSYANIESGQQEFFLAQIDRAAGAGKFMQIDLFDPGDVGNKAWVQILSPDGNVYTPTVMTWTADSNASAGHRGPTTATCIQTYGSNTSINPPAGGTPACTDNATSGGQFFQNSWLRITIPLGQNYGATGLTPADPQNPRGEPGWWKIRYTVNSGNDTTTWQVSLLGNPVHLVLP